MMQDKISSKLDLKFPFFRQPQTLSRYKIANNEFSKRFCLAVDYEPKNRISLNSVEKATISNFRDLLYRKHSTAEITLNKAILRRLATNGNENKS
jgi:hypothetical protein